MRRQSCEQCRQELPLRDLIQIQGKTLCLPCADRYLKEPGRVVQQSEVQKLTDPTCCAVCAKDFGEQELGRVAGQPVCPPCTKNLRQRPFPLWLRAAMAVLLALLVVSLVHGVGYFKAEAALIRGQRFLATGQYAEASGELGKVLEAAPDCRQAMLLKIKADLLSDNISAAIKGVNRARGINFEGELIKEINALMSRFEEAMKAQEKAMELAKAGKEAEALPFAKQAHQIFPESRSLNFSYIYLQGSVCFEQKDYDGFLKSAQQVVEMEPNDPTVVAMLASALAAKFAGTGDESFRERAQAALANAKKLSRTPEEQETFKEYSERIEYRLKSREIIDKAEYDRRFRGGKP